MYVSVSKIQSLFASGIVLTQHVSKERSSGKVRSLGTVMSNIEFFGRRCFVMISNSTSVGFVGNFGSLLTMANVRGDGSVACMMKLSSYREVSSEILEIRSLSKSTIRMENGLDGLVDSGL